MLLIIDNYDSFTYNLVQYLGELVADMQVVLNDEVSVDHIENELAPDRLLISPGPGTPDSAGITLDAIARFAGKIPILGDLPGLGHLFKSTDYGEFLVPDANDFAKRVDTGEKLVDDGLADHAHSRRSALLGFSEVAA